MLSIREKEILVFLPEGLSNKEIAITLGITERTVKAHLTSIMKKVNLTNRVKLAIAVYSGVLTDGAS